MALDAAKPVSQPCSGNNTPETYAQPRGGSSALDLSELTPPFGTYGRHAAHIKRHCSVKRAKWNWIWSRNNKEAGEKPVNRKSSRKGRHISCPDITNASNESSRSASPVSSTASASRKPKKVTPASAAKTTRFALSDFETTDDLRPLQYCHVSEPYECFFVEAGWDFKFFMLHSK